MEIPKEQVQELQEQMGKFMEQQKKMHVDLLKIIEIVKLIAEGSKRGFEQNVLSIMLLDVMKQDMTPLMGTFVDRVTKMLRSSAAEAGVIYWVTTGEEIDQKKLEASLRDRIEQMRKDMKEGR